MRHESCHLTEGLPISILAFYFQILVHTSYRYALLFSPSIFSEEGESDGVFNQSGRKAQKILDFHHIAHSTISPNRISLYVLILRLLLTMAHIRLWKRPGTVFLRITNRMIQIQRVRGQSLARKDPRLDVLTPELCGKTPG